MVFFRKQLLVQEQVCYLNQFNEILEVIFQRERDKDRELQVEMFFFFFVKMVEKVGSFVVGSIFMIVRNLVLVRGLYCERQMKWEECGFFMIY